MPVQQRSLVLLCLVAFGFAAGEPASAETQTVTDVSGWHLSLQTYAWAFGDAGDLTVEGRKAHLDDSFLDGTYANIKSFAEAGPVSADIKEELLFVELGGFYRALDNLRLWRAAPEYGGGVLTIDALVGGRYTALSLDTDTDVLGAELSRDRRRDWVDPFIGARALLQVTDRFDVILRGDVGGFGAGSDISANGMALLGYHFGMGDAVGEVWGGYRALYQDYEAGSFAWDMPLHGPILGFTARW